MNMGFNDLWPTKLYLNKIDEDINKQLCDAIFLEIGFNNSIMVSDYFDILNEGTSKVFQIFRDTIVIPSFINYLNHIDIDSKEFPDFKIKSWLTGVYEGYNIPIHNHSGATLSAVFYILCDNVLKGGELVLLDSRLNANRGYKPQFKKLFENMIYSPNSGEYIIFPSHVYHQTIPFFGKIRMAIVVDLFL